MMFNRTNIATIARSHWVATTFWSDAGLCFRLFLYILYTSGIERCADVMVSAAARRSILVGGGAAPVEKIGVGGAAQVANRIFFKDSRKISFYPQHCLMTFLCVGGW